MQVPAFQPIRFHRLKDGHKQVLDLEDERLKFEVKWVAPQIVAEIVDEMDKAFLLAAWHSIIPRVEI